jgi:hypothetical protein
MLARLLYSTLALALVTAQDVTTMGTPTVAHEAEIIPSQAADAPITVQKREGFMSKAKTMATAASRGVVRFLSEGMSDGSIPSLLFAGCSLASFKLPASWIPDQEAYLQDCVGLALAGLHSPRAFPLILIAAVLNGKHLADVFKEVVNGAAVSAGDAANKAANKAASGAADAVMGNHGTAAQAGAIGALSFVVARASNQVASINNGILAGLGKAAMIGPNLAALLRGRANNRQQL